MSEIKKASILYSNMWIGFTEDKRNIAGAFKGICDGLSEADTLGYYRGDLAEIAAKLGLFLEDGEKHDWQRMEKSYNKPEGNYKTQGHIW